MSYKPRSLFRLIEEMNHSLFLPHIQRPFVWELDQMRRLFDSLMLNYPIQTLLFWRTKSAIKARRFMDQVSWDIDLSTLYDAGKSKENVEKVFVLDGQQRLQTLYSLFAGGIVTESGTGTLEAWARITAGDVLPDDGMMYSLRFEKQSPGVEWYRLRNLREADSALNSEEVADKINEALDASLSDVGEVRTQRQRRVRKNVGQLGSLLREEKHFWVQELDGVANAFPYKTVLNIFVRVNSGGTRLEAADLMFAAMKEKWSEIEERVEEVARMLNASQLGFDKSLVLKCLVVAHGKGAELEPEKFTDKDGDELLEAIESSWTQAEEAFRQLADFIDRDLKLYSPKAIRTFNSFVSLFDYLYHNPRPDEPTRNLMRGFHYKAQLFGWFGAQTDNIINALHTRMGKRVPAFPMKEVKDYFSASRGLPVTLTAGEAVNMRLRHIVLNLVYTEAWGASPFKVQFDGNEPHIDHIYPKHALASKLGMGTGDINTMGNYRFVGATDNLRKRAELPASYFGRLKAASVDLKKHLLVDEFANDPTRLTFDEATYKRFRDERAQEIVKIALRVVNPEGP
jgi:hypothetical protein